MAELTGQSNQGSLATTPVVIVPAPSSGFRMIRSAYFNNVSGQNVTIHLQKTIGASSYVFHTELMQTGDMIEMGDGDCIILSVGETFEAFIDETVAVYPIFLASFGDK